MGDDANVGGLSCSGSRIGRRLACFRTHAELDIIFVRLRCLLSQNHGHVQRPVALLGPQVLTQAPKLLRQDAWVATALVDVFGGVAHQDHGVFLASECHESLAVVPHMCICLFEMLISDVLRRH